MAPSDQDRDSQPHRREERPGEQRAPGLFEHDHEVEERADASVLLRDAKGGPAEVRDLLPHRGVEPVLALHELAHGLGAAFLGEELARGAPQHLLLFRKSEVHDETRV